MRRLLLALLIAVAAIAAAIAALLPPAAVASPKPRWTYGWPVVKGVYHVHSARSDGTGTMDEIAAAAARQGLRFVIVTDHGDGTRTPDPPTYRSGVLCLDAVEVSTTLGHLVALGIGTTPYRLAGLPRDVIEDVHRFGGIAIAAHPVSPKAALRWDDWNAPFDGLEWLNADSEWRDEFWGSLGRALVTYFFRPKEALASMLDRPAEVLQQWDARAHQRHIVGLAGTDAHARLDVRQAGDPYQGGAIARLPSYEASFGVFANYVVMDAPFNGNAAVDARNLLTSIETGRVFTVIDGAASLGGFEVKALSKSAFARPGEYIDSPVPVEIEAVLAAPPDTTMVVLRDGMPIYDTKEPRLRIDVGQDPASYRIEAYLPSWLHPPSIPWLLTNPIYVNLRDAHARPAAAVSPLVKERTAIATEWWQPEASSGSESRLATGALEDGTPALMWHWQLAGGPAVAQFAAIRFPVDKRLAPDTRVQMRIRADRPLRISAQLRVPAERGEQRWSKYFYLDQELRTVELGLAGFRPVGPALDRPPLDKVDSLLLVIDTLNTLPGTAATIALPDLWLVR